MNEAPGPIDLAVVGHTNTGKTSLLRTLLRDETFGQIADRPGTTRHVESAQLLSEAGTPLLILRDTPGLEDAMGVLDYLEQLNSPAQRHDGPERIRRLLDSPEAAGRFEQECRVLATVLATHAALYVIDVRDPVLPKHRDELLLLAACGHPILPVLNFTRSPQADTAAWREALARLGLHATVDFDTVAPALDGEARMLERLALMLDQHADALQNLQADLARQRQRRLQDATRLIAELLMDAAALRLSCAGDAAGRDAAVQALRKRSREREQECVRALLKRYHFSRATFPHHPLPLEGERWGMDLFNPQTLKVFGIQVGKGVATGAMAGAAVDAVTGGLSLGAAALIGAALGGAWQGAGQWGRRLAGRLSGHLEITLDDAVLQLLARRQLALVHALERRGHAAVQPLEGTLATTGDVPSDVGPDLPAELQDILQRARSHPGWSTIGPSPVPDADRDAQVERMAGILTQMGGMASEPGGLAAAADAGH